MKYDPEYQNTEYGEVMCDTVSGWVWHKKREDCPIAEPHHIEQCTLFLPPRTVPEPELRDRVLRWMRWGRVCEGLDEGKSMWSMIADRTYSFTSSDVQ